MIIKDFTHTLINGKLCGNYDIYYFNKYDKEPYMGKAYRTVIHDQYGADKMHEFLDTAAAAITKINTDIYRLNIDTFVIPHCQTNSEYIHFDYMGNHYTLLKLNYNFTVNAQQEKNQ